MLKRKRPGKESVEEEFLTLRQELYKALRMVKGFERQRQAKRLRESKGITEKTRRLENEIAVLKVLFFVTLTVLERPRVFFVPDRAC